MTSFNKRQILFALASTTVALFIPSLSFSFKRKSNAKILVLYYSKSGNTQKIAHMIGNCIDADIVQIKALKPYPSNYDETVLQVRKENAQNYSPQLQDNIPNLSQYDTIILGSPIWANHLSLPIKTFLKTHNLAGKTILPFLTYIVSRSGGECYQQISDMQPQTKIANILTILGEDAVRKQNDVSQWLQENNIAMIGKNNEND